MRGNSNPLFIADVHICDSHRDVILSVSEGSVHPDAAAKC